MFLTCTTLLFSRLPKWFLNGFHCGTNPEHSSVFIYRPSPIDRFHILLFCHRKSCPNYATKKSPGIIQKCLTETRKGNSDSTNPPKKHRSLQAVNYTLHTKERNILMSGVDIELETKKQELRSYHILAR